MKRFVKPISIGKRNFHSNVFYAPLAGCSDFPFRKMAAKYKPALMYCEMVKMDALVRREPRTLRMLDFAKDMHPIGGQICGSKPEIAGQAAKIIEELGFDVIDLNCGCPVDKITKDGSGSGMLKTPDLIGEVITNMVAAVKIPVTVKIRAGWDSSSINAAEVTKIAERAGAQAICIHGRTRAQAYKGPANWDYIKQCVDVATTIKVIGNGDLFDAPAVDRIIEHTGCDAVLISRGTLGQPWIAEDILKLSEGEPLPVRTLQEFRETLYEHFLHTVDYQQSNEKRVVIDMRRVGCWYLKNAPGARVCRGLISKATSIAEVKDLILNFPFEDYVGREDPFVNSLQEGEEEECVTTGC